MLARLLYKLTNHLKVRVIPINGRPYLERYALFRFPKPDEEKNRRAWITAYLHHFASGDPDRGVHDHPWTWAVAIPLVGGYLEERVRYLDARFGWMPKISHTTRFVPRPLLTLRSFHKIVKIQPGTWTLFIHGPFRRGWGFLEECVAEGEDGQDVPALLYYQPKDVKDAKNWRENAPRGRDIRGLS